VGDRVDLDAQIRIRQRRRHVERAECRPPTQRPEGHWSSSRATGSRCRRSDTGGPIEVPANVAWINVFTGATGTVSVPALASAPVRITTGRGRVAIGGALAGFGLPGAATIAA
jgi:hypothetical protein